MAPSSAAITRETALTTAPMRMEACTTVLGDAALAQLLLVAVQAHAAAVDRRHRHGPELEVVLVDAGVGDDVHAQLGGKRRVLAVLHQVERAVVDVVHAHDGGGRLGGGQRLGRQRAAVLQAPGSQSPCPLHRRSGDETAPLLLLAQHRPRSSATRGSGSGPWRRREGRCAGCRWTWSDRFQKRRVRTGTPRHERGRAPAKPERCRAEQPKGTPAAMAVAFLGLVQPLRRPCGRLPVARRGG